jgi:hypothetical protein
MSAPSSRRRDPFRPPETQGQRSLELAQVPAKPAGPATLAPPDGAAPSSPASTAIRPRVKYKRMGWSWVTLVVLGFAAVGVATVGGGLVKKVTALVMPGPRVIAPRPAAPVIYRPLAKDDAVLVEIQVSPAEARLMLDGEPLPSNPVRLPRGAKPHKLAAMADGYAPLVQELVADKAKTVHLTLPRAKR